MSIIEFGSQKPKKTEPPKGSMIQEAIHIVDIQGPQKIHDTLEQRLLQAQVTLDIFKEARYSITLVLALNEEEYRDYVEHIFELDYAVDVFREVYEQTPRDDMLGNAICLTFLPRIVEIIDWTDELFKEINDRWEEGRDLNSESGMLFIQVCEHLGIDNEPLMLDYEKMLEISRSTARYLTAEVVNSRLIINEYREKKEALRAIMSSKTLNASNLIARY